METQSDLQILEQKVDTLLQRLETFEELNAKVIVAFMEVGAITEALTNMMGVVLTEEQQAQFFEIVNEKRKKGFDLIRDNFDESTIDS